MRFRRCVGPWALLEYILDPFVVRRWHDSEQAESIQVIGVARDSQLKVYERFEIVFEM